MNIKITPLIQQALTTKAASKDKSYKEFVAKGDKILKNSLEICTESLLLTGDQKKDFIDTGSDAEILVPVFDIIIARYSLPVRKSSLEKRCGIPEKVKAGMLRALLGIFLAENKVELYKEIINEILKALPTIPFENPLNKINRLVDEKTNKVSHYEDFLVIERDGGTEDKPIYKACFNFEGRTAEVFGISGAKIKAKKEVIKKWLSLYGSSYFQKAA